VIPEIDEVCYGRDVGYGIRRIELGDDVHAISGTKKRISAQPGHPIIWLTGQSGSGKTTLAVAIRALVRDAVILDGDDMRESISAESFSQEDRHAHNLRVARLAQVLSKQSSVIVSVIATFAETRRQINTITSPVWVLCRRFEQKEGAQFPYELPDTDEIEVLADGDACSPPENAFR
jgi:ABC-type dipeptide/oligopeptide/nickel transport system ATPase component